MSVRIRKNSLYVKNETTNELQPIDVYSSGSDKTMAEIQTFANNVKSETITEVQNVINSAESAVNNATANRDTLVQSITSTLENGTDTSLSTSGVAADAKVVGDRIGALESKVNNIKFSYVDGALYYEVL